MRAGSHKIGRRRSGELRDTQRAQVAADSGEHDATPRRRDQVRVLKRPGLRFSPLGLMTSRVALKTHQGIDPYWTASAGTPRPMRKSADQNGVPRDSPARASVNAKRNLFPEEDGARLTRAHCSRLCARLYVPGCAGLHAAPTWLPAVRWVPRCVKAAMAGKLWPGRLGPTRRVFPAGYQMHSDERCTVPGFPAGTPTVDLIDECTDTLSI